MQSTLQHEISGNTLTVRLYGDCSDLQTCLDVLEKCRELLKDLKPAKALLDLQGVTKTLSYIETFFLVRRPDFVPPHPQYGLLDRPREYGTFFTNTSFNVGRIFRLFHDPDEARAWLEEPT